MKIEFIKDEMLQLYRVKTDPVNFCQGDSFEVEFTDEEIKEYFIVMTSFLNFQKRLATEHLKSVTANENNKRELPGEALVRNHAYDVTDPRAFIKLSDLPIVNESGPTWPELKEKL